MKIRSLISECIGTFALIFIGAGAAALGSGVVAVAFAHGLVVLGFVYAYGHLSGVHINPAVTLGVLVAKAMDLKTAIGYWIAQFVGGVLGASALCAILSGMNTSLGATVLAANVTPFQGFFLETILTFFLVTVILHTAIAGRSSSHAGMAIGLTLTFCILMGLPVTGASLNPARTLGPAIVSGNYADIWVYFAGPLLGGGLAAILYSFLSKQERI